MLPHDALVKVTLAPVEHARGFFRSVLPPALVARLDLSTLTLLPTNYVGRWLGQLYTDLFYGVRFVDGGAATLYLAFEHESSEARRLVPVRFLRAKAYFLERWIADHPEADRVPPVIPVLLHHGRQPWPGPTRYRDVVEVADADRALVEPYVTDFRILLVDLAATGRDEELWQHAFEQSTTALCRLTLLMLQHAPDNPGLVALMREHLGLWQQVLEAPSGMDAFLAVLRYIQTVNRHVDTDEMRGFVVEVAGAEAEELVMGKTIGELKQEWQDEGREQGLAQGLARSLLKLITLRFGAPDAQTEARVRAASIEQLEAWTDAILTAPDLATLLGRQP
ncbi:MAG: Rpn family recombination-promoting nuclease/putative transposase [Myxococcales bacterium]|nr:Rpn family recombination-promoting nuclease/putative transposase [Myxococcales bacterium]